MLAYSKSLRRMSPRVITLALLLFAAAPPSSAQTPLNGGPGDERVITIQNALITCDLILRSGLPAGERIAGKPDWIVPFGTEVAELTSDGDFAFELMWTGWRAPGRANNADNLVRFSSPDFQFERIQESELPGGVKELRVFFRVKQTRLLLQLVYQLEPDAFYIRRKVAVRDTSGGRHFLLRFWPLVASLRGQATFVKEGGFGQPIALSTRQAGAFVGIEYPAAENIIVPGLDSDGILSCSHEVGEIIGTEWLESEWVVEGLAPNLHVKQWFMEYVSRLRVAPVRPYTLYNSWYDLRSPEYTTDPRTVMNEQNVMRTVTRLRQAMVDQHGITLDAFVLDDGWDVYKSDWVLRTTEFPLGLRPISYPLQSMGTSLGLWLGPGGGYSHRDLRVGWMKEQGFEVVGDQLCLGGEKYRALLKSRVVDFVKNEGVGYFKWDGIQFSCSEPGHGHPVGVYSRRAILNTLIDISRSVRAENPDIYLNTTSGTWLSPWWVQYSNQIWMDGQDYGFAQVPSISMRDAAMTYRDIVLYEDFRIKDLWFPMANMMTHGIIKGSLERLGGEDDPLDKFTDDVVLYLARGVSMWELYVTPDLLTEGEWNALAQSIKWAKDRFPILAQTEMVGGNPRRREPYAFVHFKGNRGIVAARNPSIAPSGLTVSFDPALGLDPNSAGLVLERVYPTRWISPKLYFAEDSVAIELDGYETAIFELYPLEEASGPLVAGARFTTRLKAGLRDDLVFYPTSRSIRLLNPGTVKSVRVGGELVRVDSFALAPATRASLVRDPYLQAVPRGRRTEVMTTFTVDGEFQEPTLSVLLSPDPGSEGLELPELSLVVDGKQGKFRLEHRAGFWAWAKIDLKPGEHTATVRITAKDVKKLWKGTVGVWIIGRERLQGTDVSFESNRPTRQRPLPPPPWPAGEIRRTIPIGKTAVEYLP